ncbi:MULTISPECIES: S41 family peptidase [unclassified Pseudoxanthomonas]|uniref:S41 family peptidase n=1 Tax=unclassified Pseudoxanthomonas TaxID=2645906 RepID=UPI0030778C86
MKKWNGILIAAWLATFPAAAEQTMQWRVTGDSTHYVLEGGGDAQSEAGASLSVQSQGDVGESYGGGVAAVDATPFRGQRVRLSGRIDAHSVVGGAGLWLRADGPSGVVAFANTQREPVLGDASNVSREVEISVPSSAQTVLFGPLLTGRGRLLVRQLRLERSPADTDADVPPAQIVEAAVAIMRDHALNANRIDWSAVQSALVQKAEVAKGPADAYAVIDSLIQQLGDRHSVLMLPVAARRYAQQGQPSEAPRIFVRDGVATILVPGFWGTSHEAAQAFARTLASGIAEVSPQVTGGWVVDLRDNPGGNMWPMLSGLSTLLGKEPVGFFRDAKGRDTPWRINPPGMPIPDLTNAQVAVLTGARTASSGEAIAVAFRGRPNTRSFGQPTAGLSTGNRQYELPGGARLGLATARFVDRTGQVYGEKISPDELVREQDAISRAEKWLNRDGEV